MFISQKQIQIWYESKRFLLLVPREVPEVVLVPCSPPRPPPWASPPARRRPQSFSVTGRPRCLWTPAFSSARRRRPASETRSTSSSLTWEEVVTFCLRSCWRLIQRHDWGNWRAAAGTQRWNCAMTPTCWRTSFSSIATLRLFSRWSCLMSCYSILKNLILMEMDMQYVDKNRIQWFINTVQPNFNCQTVKLFFLANIHSIRTLFNNTQ